MGLGLVSCTSLNVMYSSLCNMFAHSFDQLSSAAVVTSPGFEAQADPCSRDTVLSVLRASRKRDVDDDEGAHEAGQKSKRRYLLELIICTEIVNSFSLTASFVFLLLEPICNNHA